MAVTLGRSPLRGVLLIFAGLFTATLAQKDPHALPGRSGIVHLFEWKFDDIASECERFLGPYGFAGVQVSPVHECLVVTNPDRPWWERYQVISYNISSRSGNEEQFADMVRRCKAAGIRIYVDVVINHMTGDHPKAVGTAGSRADPSRRSYPAVPYDSSHFHNPCGINDYNNPEEVRNCELVGLHDLNQGLAYVREKIVQFLNVLLSHGVAGFRVDAAKHMWPADLRHILRATDDLSTKHGFRRNARPFVFQEVIDMGGEGISSSQYTDFGRVTEFKYGAELGKAFRGGNALKWLRTFGNDWGLMSSDDAVVFIDNHDNQRGHGGGGQQILTYKDGRLYKMAIAFMMSWPYGVTRIMSSFHFTDTDAGPPVEGKCTSVTNWWDNTNNQIAYCRGDKGFIAFNGEYGIDLKRSFNTCLPAGVYCDVISGTRKDGRCTGKSITVSADGSAHIKILANEEDGVLAIHVNAKL